MPAAAADETVPPLTRWAYGIGDVRSKQSEASQKEEAENTLETILQAAISARSSIQRVSHLEGVAAAAEAAEYGDCARAAPQLGELVGDSEADVRLEALRQLAQLGMLLRAKDAGRAQSDIPHVLLPMILAAALDDSDEVARQVVVSFAQLTALLPRDVAASAAISAIQRLDGRGSEETAVAAARLFAHSAANWSQAALHDRVPELLRRWCSHRDFIVREAIACCMSLVGDHVPMDVWQCALLPWFSQLCRDNNWRVRRAAALDLPRLAGKLWRQQQRTISRADSTCSCSTSSDDGAAACCARSSGSGPAAAEGDVPRCRTSGVPLEPLDASPTGGCSRTTPEQLKGRAGATVPHVWSAHALRPSSAVAARSMGKHPLSSSLLVDEPMACDSPRSSSSLSSSDDRVLAGDSPSGDASPRSPHTPAAAARGDTPLGASRLGPGRANGSSTSSSSRSSGGGGADGDEPAQDAAAREAQQACELALEQPELHACWATLRDCVDGLTADSSHWVKVTALGGLGPCLLAVPACQVSGLLVGRFVAMGSSTTVISDVSVALACAQSVGMVAARLGPARWPEVRPAFSHLQASRDPAVLQELVAALPLMAAHLGEPVLRGDLLPALLAVVHDHLSWVDAAVVTAVPPLLEALPAASHEPLLKIVARLAQGDAQHERCRTWRLRRGIAAQLGRMANACGRAATTDVLWPAAIALCSDPVAAVRDAAAVQVGPLLSALLSALPPAELQALQQQPAARAQRASWDQQDEHRQAKNSSSRDQACRHGQGPTGGSKRGSDDSGADVAAGAGGADSLGAAKKVTRTSLEITKGGRPLAVAAATATNTCGSYGSSSSGSSSDDCEDAVQFGGLPCALAAPAADADPGSPGAKAAGMGSRTDSFDSTASGGSSSCGGDDSDGEASSGSGGSTPECASPVRHPGAGARNGGSTPGAAALHPVLGAAHPVLGAVHPAMAPVGTWTAQPRLQPRRSSSARELHSSPGGLSPAPVARGVRRLSSTSRLVASAHLSDGGSSSGGGEVHSGRAGPSPAAGANGSSTSGGGGGAAARAPALDPLTVPPALYVDSLVECFARSPTFRGRQLFVPMGLSMLAHASHLLPRQARRMITDALEALAADPVSCVRVVAEGAAAACQSAAAERAASLANGGGGSKQEADGVAAALSSSKVRALADARESGVDAAVPSAPGSAHFNIS